MEVLRETNYKLVCFDGVARIKGGEGKYMPYFVKM